MRVDRIFEGGKLLTMDPARPLATTLAVLGGRWPRYSRAGSPTTAWD